jgi:plastocyanin
MTLAASAVAVIAIAGCGGGGGNSATTAARSNTAAAPPNTAAAAGANAPSGGQRLSLTADPSGQLRFDKKTLQANAGAVTIKLSNPAPLSHNVSIDGNGVNQMGETVTQGGTSTVSANLKPGTYTFYCSVPGHRQAGMFGTLTVK